MRSGKVKKPLSLFIAALFALSAFWGGAAFAFKLKPVSAADAKFAGVTLAIANGEFNSSSGSSLIKTPSDWTGAALNGTSTAMLHHGVISMDAEVYTKNNIEDYHLGRGVPVPKNPFSNAGDFPVSAAVDPGKNALMVNTKDAAGAFAYTSGSLTLEANKCYEISAWVMTFAFSESGASIKLVDADTNLSIGTKAKFNPDPAKNIEEKLLAFRNIDTSAFKDVKGDYMWREYKFNVQTSFIPMNVKVSLGVGDAAEERGVKTSGIAFFDHVTGTTISRKSFNENAAKNASSSDFLSYSFVAEGAKRGTVKDDNSSFIKNGSFQKACDGVYNALGKCPVCGDDSGTVFVGDPCVNVDGGFYDEFGICDVCGDDSGIPFVGDPCVSGILFDSFDNWSWINDKDEHPDWWGPNNSLRPSSPGKPGVEKLSGKNAVSPFGKDTALLIENALTASASGVISAPFTLQRFRYYRLSVWYLTLDGGQANVYLTMPDSEKAAKNARKTLSSITSLSSAKNPDMENWQQATFYIKGSSISDYNGVSLELWLGYGDSKSAGTHSSGAVYFDQIEIQYLDSEEYAKYSANGTAATLDTLAGSSSITNGNFTDIEYTDFDAFDLAPVAGVINYRPNTPLAPASWTFSSGEDKSLNPKAAGFDYNDTAVVRGVIAGNETYSGVPGSKYANTALTIQNNGLSAAGYSSPDISVSPDSFQKITVSVSTKDEAKAFLQLTENGSPVATIENIKTNPGQWLVYSFIVKTGGDTSSLKLTLWNGWCSENASNAKKNLSSGAVYFANVNSEAGTEDDYNKAVADGAPKTAMPVDMQSNFGLFGSADGALKVPFRYTGTGAGDSPNAVSGGILDTQRFTTSSRQDLGTDNPGTTSDSLRYVLTINNRISTAFKYTYAKAQTLNASSYYKVTVSVQTAEITGRGAYISLAGVKDAVFSGIDTDEVVYETVNGVKTEKSRERKYRTYTFFIATGDSPLTFNYELGLGDVKNQKSYTKGYAFFEDMSVATISKIEYNNTKIENSTKLSFITSGDKDTAKSDKDKSAWDWMWLPTVIFGVALLFVIVMVSIRRVAPAVGRLIQKNKKAKAASYDRSESTKASKRGTPRSADDGYIDVVETGRTKRAAKAANETPEEKEGNAGKESGGETKPDAYTDYFED